MSLTIAILGSMLLSKFLESYIGKEMGEWKWYLGIALIIDTVYGFLKGEE
jgi:hypothetical protein